MYLNKTKLILESQLKNLKEFSPEQVEKIQVAMHLYAINQVNEFRNQDIKDEAVNWLKLFGPEWYKTAILLIRRWRFRMAKRQAIILAEVTGYKTYVIQKGRTTFQILNSYEINYNKKMKVLGKDVDFMEVEKISSFIAYAPK